MLIPITEDFHHGLLAGPELAETGVLHELTHVLQSEDLAACRQQQLLHVFAPDAESTSRDTRDDLESGLIRRLVLHAEGAEVLHAGHLIARCAVVLRKLGFDDYLGIEFARDDEIGRLVESVELLGAFGLSVADAGAGKNVLGRILDDVAD